MIIISPYAKALPNGGVNPKNYPFWSELISMISEPIVQVGVHGEQPLVDDLRFGLSLPDLAVLIAQCRTWISCDSFFQHYCWDLGKPGIVLWGQSDPNIYGHHSNINLLKDRSYLYHNQFLSWDLMPLRTDCWVEPQTVLTALKKF